MLPSRHAIRSTTPRGLTWRRASLPKPYGNCDFVTFWLPNLCVCRSEWLRIRAGGDESDVTPPAAAVGGTAVDDADKWWSAKLTANRPICNDMYAKAAKDWLDLKYY